MSNPRDTEILEQNSGSVAVFTHASTDAQTPSVGAKIIKMVVVVAAVFTTVTGNFTGYAGITYPVGHVINLRATSVTLASGTVDFYEGS